MGRRRPGAWFRLEIAERRGRYALALLPNLMGSLERFRRACELTGAPYPPEGAEPVFVARSLHFVSRADHMYRQVRPRLPNPLSLGLLDQADLNVDRPELMDPRRVRKLGPFQVGGDPAAERFVQELLKGAGQKREGRRR